MNLESLETRPPVAPGKTPPFFINRNFALLWLGQSISVFGSWITSSGLSLAAVLVLSATPVQMSLLTALETIPVLLFGLFAGVWVDRLRRRPLIIMADLGRALVLLSIPLAAIYGWLRIEQLYVVAAVMGILTVFFDIAYRSFLPTVVPREHVVEGNSKLSTTDALAEIGGPSLSGLLIQAITAPVAILFDALSFLCSALCFGLIRTPEDAPDQERTHGSVWQDIRAGLQYVLRDPRLRTIAACSATRNFFGGAFATLYTLYVVRNIGISPLWYGVLVTVGGVGALLGALLAARVVQRFGIGKVLAVSILIEIGMSFFIPLASGPLLLAITCLVVSQLIGDCSATIYAINEMSLRQRIVPDHILGRVNASMNVLIVGVGPIGAIIAGVVSELIGIQLTLFISVAGSLLFLLLWVILSRMPRWS